ncbi:MAG: hypothetical protein JKY89_03675 [Immundisolibacteraceae bacterium]|nr:hypothetical protein [Immundisolibacteraceae bacterium]
MSLKEGKEIRGFRNPNKMTERPPPPKPQPKKTIDKYFLSEFESIFSNWSFEDNLKERINNGTVRLTKDGKISQIYITCDNCDNKLWFKTIPLCEDCKKTKLKSY